MNKFVKQKKISMQIISIQESQEIKKLTKQQLKKIVPQGSCIINQSCHIESIQSLLKIPCIQNIILPFDARFFQCIILKKAVQDQQPIYHLVYENERKRLLSAQKQPNNIGCNYLISKSEKPKKDENFVGKLRGNFRNNQFMIYDSGQNPKNKISRKRKQLGYLQFKQESIFNNDSEKLNILIPKPIQMSQTLIQNKNFRPYDFVPEQNQNLLQQQYNKKFPYVIKLTKEKFQGQSQQAICKKSMQLAFSSILKKEQNKIRVSLFQQKKSSKEQVFTLKTRSQNTFHLKIGWPMNIIQGFAIVLALIERNSK